MGALRFWDAVVLVLYFGAMAAMGPLFARRSKTTEGYFLGERSFPGWLVGFSMFATAISSITFVAYPADAFKTAWLRMLPNLTLPLGVLVASRVFLPFFRRGRITSAYEYLEARFGPNVRLYASCAFIAAQAVRISMILYLVSILVSQVTGLNPLWSVIVGGAITGFYTITGGIHAVIWTDFIQAFVLWGGGIACLVTIVCALPGGLGQIFSTALADGKFQFAEWVESTGELRPVAWGFSLTEKTVLMMLLMGLGDWLMEHTGDQTIIQRYCASKTARDARRAMWMSCWFCLPTWALFMFIGTGLYAYYKVNYTPETAAMLSGETKAEDVLPFFVLRHLPAGVSGLVIAAVLAAAMSSISSSINSASASAIVDIYRRRMAKNRSERHYLLAAKTVGAVLSAIMLAGAVVLTVAKTTTLQDTARILTALSAGGLLGLYLLGFLTTRGDGRAVGVAIVCTLLFTAWMTLSAMGLLDRVGLGVLECPTDIYYTGLLGHMLMFGVGYGLGRVLRRRVSDLNNLTLWTQDKTPLT